MNSQDFENLAILSCHRFRGKLHVVDYVDITSGEIIDAKTIQAQGMKVIRPEARRRREEKLNSLRKEVRNFAVFLLKFRSQLGGLLIPLDGLVKWYGALEGKDAKHIRRYLPRLIDAGIRGDTFRAYRIFDDLRSKKRAATFEQSCQNEDERRAA